MLVLLLLCFGLTLVGTGSVGSRIVFEKLIDIQFRERRSEWEASGRPVGGVETRRYFSFWRSGFSTSRVFNQFLQTPPSWVMSSPHSARLLLRMRVLTALIFVGVILIFAGGILAVR